MLKIIIMFRLHIFCGVVKLCGWKWILSIVETLSQGIEHEEACCLWFTGCIE